VINKLLGALLGFFKGIIFISIFVWFFELIPNHKISKIILSESKITKQLINARTAISEIFYFDKPVKETEKRIEKLIRDLES
jgi:Colicin V production protein.